ncbi:HEAT repeat domain-containing protein [Candidatus Thorarchaeota archaeon]|nr:MAG: HEAT repeat domain-containing protein [Candidatus Thorarchaeota archaeon]
MPSRQWDYFMDNFFGDPYMMWHDGIDPTSVCGLEGAERDQAEAMLIESMQQGSYWAPMGLRELRSQKAVPVMKEMLLSASGVLLIEIAIALNVIEDTLDYNQYVLHVLRTYPSPYTRLKAAMKLRDFPTPEVIEALFDAVNDVDYLVRNHASESLLAIHGLQPTISEHKEIFKLIIVDYDKTSGRSTEEASKAYKKAEQLLRGLFEK